MSSWVVVRVLVLGVFGLGSLVHPYRPHGSELQGVLGWDAAWYTRIAEQGYEQVDAEGRRFFPVYPMIGSGLSDLSGIPAGICLLVLSNVCALVVAVLVHRLVILEGWGPRVADRAVWAVALLPAGFVYVMAYSESLAGCVLVGAALAVRTGHWSWAIPLCALAGAVRPNGIAIAAFVAVEAIRGWRATTPGQRCARVLATAGAPLGLAAFLTWNAVVFSDPFGPLRIATEPQLRGGDLVNPLTSGVDLSVLPHVPWVILAILLTVVCARRMPASYTLFTVAACLFALNSRGFLSFERVVSIAFPLAIAAALVVPEGRRRAAAVAAGGVLCCFALAATLTLYVP